MPHENTLYEPIYKYNLFPQYEKNNTNITSYKYQEKFGKRNQIRLRC